MRAHYLQHVAFEGTGIIVPWLSGKGFEIGHTGFFDDPTLPPVADIDLLVIMGGPMGANDEAHYAWLQAEKRFIADCIAAGKAVLGICLGAQLIASALGARVYRNTQPEIGWFPIQASTDAAEQPLPQTLEAFHWHSDTFDLPVGAELLACSAACRHQAFRIGANVLGLQCHLESTPETVQELVTHCGAQLTPQGYVQSAERILAAEPQHYRQMNAVLGDLLERLISGAACATPRA